MIAILISLELVLNAVEINFAAFNRFLYPHQLEGMFFTLFGIAITAAETAVALAIIINAYRSVGNVNINSMNTMKN
jgi:NADH-quinone oxidoreductase subunit K